MPRRSTLKAYYEELLVMEKVVPCDLVADWPSDLVEVVRGVFRSAYAKAGLAQSSLKLEDGSKPQSAGNQIEAVITEKLARHFEGWTLARCIGPGYPDRLLENGSAKLPVEFKSTGQWDDRDSNRCVLTSSSSKLREQFVAPIHHLLVTVKFDRTGDLATVLGLRLDFLMTSTPVNIRFEGSVTQKLLADAVHPTDEF
jgi:hypothetical protein